jgi:DNA (cytosine-5)-methyltransferase 1
MLKIENNKIPVLSFYSGGGFFDLGFEMAGYEIVWTNEIDKIFAELHSAGITSWRKARGNGIKAEIFNTKSIDNISSSEIITEAFPNGIPETFGIIGGPPCQDFSSNGKLAGFRGERGKLTILFFDKILELLPSFFVMENVIGLLRRKAHKERLAELIKEIEDDYFIDHKVLNALEFGVPQSRERVFFVGIRKDRIPKNSLISDSGEKWFSFPSNPKYSNALRKYNWPAVVDFGKRLKAPADIPLELCVESCLIPNHEIGVIANANEYFNLYVNEKTLEDIKEGETNRPSFKRLHRFKYSPTACYGNNEVHLHPYKHRRISVREALRIQGVPDTYVLPTNLPLTKKFKMIGNGVPVPLARAVAESLKIFLRANLISKS